MVFIFIKHNSNFLLELFSNKQYYIQNKHVLKYPP